MGQRDDVLPLVVVDQVQVLECGDHILLLDAGHLRNLTERKSRTVSLATKILCNKSHYKPL